MLLAGVQLKKWMLHQVKTSGGPADLQNILQYAQKSTRQLQTVCCEAKVRKLGNVVKMVPTTKKQLEKLVHFFKVLFFSSIPPLRCCCARAQISEGLWVNPRVCAPVQAVGEYRTSS